MKPSAPRAAPARRLISPARAAEILGIGERTVRTWVAEGILQGYRLAGRKLLRVEQAEVERLAVPIPTTSAARKAVS